jgi:glycerate-2-kinase
MPRYDDHRSHLNTIIKAVLEAADPAKAVKRFLSQDDVREAKRVFIVGAGKAGAAMAEAALEIVGEKFVGGVVSVPKQTSKVLKTSEVLRFVIGGHPKPNEGSIEAGNAIAGMLKDTKEDDVVIAVISGGGSALMELPVEGMTLAELRELTDHLLKSGAPIQELNCARKHLSRIKGGGLAKMAYPARVIALILSDVIGDPLEVIASGPTVGDSTTVEEAKEILRKRNAPEKFEALLRETLKPGDSSFDRVENRLVGTNLLAREAAAQAARERGFEAVLSEMTIEGEARERAKEIVRWLGGWVVREHPRAFIFGGESTVTVRGSGIGGRNQEFVLSAAIEVKDWAGEKVLLASFGTDGVDGMTTAAGAFATSETVAAAVQKKLEPYPLLQNNDSHTFFKAVDQLIVTGATGTNVNDVVIALIYDF